MCRFFLQVAGKVDDGQRSKRTFLEGEKSPLGAQSGPQNRGPVRRRYLDADTAADAQRL